MQIEARYTTGIAVALLATGCEPPGLDGIVGAIPDNVSAVDAGGDFFAQPDEHPLLDSSPGDVIDDIQSIDGCWGARIDEQPEDDSMRLLFGGSRSIDFFRFDFEQQQMDFVRLSTSLPDAPSFLGHADAVTESVYDLQMAGEDRIGVQLMATRFTTTFGGLEEIDCCDLHPFNDGTEYELLITVDGDALIIHEAVPSSGSRIPIRDDGKMMFRFECPE